MCAEFLGTFVLILFGVGSVAVAVAGLPGSGRQAVAFGAANWLIISWGWGLAVVFGVYVAGGISGAHLNPAVTLGFAVRRDFPWRKVLPYWLAQVVGAFVAAALVYACYRWAIDASIAKAGETRKTSLSTYSIFATFPAEYFGNSWWGPLLDQIVGTGILLLLICALIDTRNTAPMSNLHPYLIGLVVVAIGLAFGTNAGYAINPARDFGPRLFTFFEGWGDIALPGTFQWFSGYWWIPIVGPLIGGVVGVLVYDLLISPVIKARLSEREEGPATEEP
ncbi:MULTISPECIES: MIP/aquaporin family protein [Streptomyces]|uniref:MIP/aquaporin family protein n=2 Tax=Streptomyces ardesiacus TaxID=285564 RepID=A0ABW8HIH2_9ACTN|nr:MULTISPECIES: MIP/aquaporin family protein [Streptomyces]KOU10850.1 MIP family channel protein [Streptomyces sp. NRRL F-4711]KOX27424.1 MIP family channel protein [Streptomyces sp. NRRL F-4707]KOX50775.1 MIP family channel protein [Streptomyces sp. NRRL F-7442]MCL7369941.1 aquaporin family protein [Streptomyces ardesiacus]